MKMKNRKPKAVNFELIPSSDNGHTPEPYRVLNEIVRRYHSDLKEAKIALAWRTSLKSDVDGHLMLGKCIRTTDLQKEFSAWDFIILLNREVWMDSEFTKEKKLALVDHELCHAAPKLDKQLEQAQDARGRKVWRTRKHDIEEFICIVQRHGCYKRDLEKFAEGLLAKRNAPLFAEALSKSPEKLHVDALN